MRILASLFAFLLCSSNLLAQQKDYALINAHVFNGSENKIYKDAIVFVKSGMIENIGKKGDLISNNYTVVDCEGNYLLPGLIDAHAHIENLESAKMALESGVTTARSASVTAFQDVAIREMVKAGYLPGPYVVAAGTFITPKLGHYILGDPRFGELINGVNTDEELKKIVNINIDRGATVLKTRGTERAGLPDTDPRVQSYSEHQLRVIVEEGAKRGAYVMTHAHGDEGARAAIKAGARSIEHGTFLKEETLRLMKEKGAFLVPTFITLEDLTLPGGDYDDPVLEVRGKFMLPIAEEVFKQAHAMGVKIVTGADNRYKPETTSRISLEAAHFVRMGMTNFEAMQSATTLAAELLLMDKQIGRISKGFEADMILVPSNPLEDINALQDVLLVMSNGQMALKRLPFAKTE